MAYKRRLYLLATGAILTILFLAIPKDSTVNSPVSATIKDAKIEANGGHIGAGFGGPGKKTGAVESSAAANLVKFDDLMDTDKVDAPLDALDDLGALPATSTPEDSAKLALAAGSPVIPGAAASFDTDLLGGKPIMSKMANETKRKELGNAAWKFLHTVLAQYPETPSDDDKETLRSFLMLFSRVYPCRECAEHFQVLLRQFPPQLSSQKAATIWGCHVHNQVNQRLGKETFDCNYIGDKYDCGCGDEEEEEGDETTDTSSTKVQSTSKSSSEKASGDKKLNVKLSESTALDRGG